MSECSYPNNDCFQFCQQCRLQRFSPILGHTSKRLKFDLALIDTRIKELDSARASWAYQRELFSGFFSTAEDFIFSHTKGYHPFLVWKDGKGKTMALFDSCQFLGLQGKQTCNCPTQLSARVVHLSNMAELIVNLHDTVTSYIANAPDKNLATKIGNELLKLSRAIVKPHTFPEQQRYKYYLAQPSRMLAREVYRWNKSLCRMLKCSPSCRNPWGIRLKRSLPLELFDT